MTDILVIDIGTSSIRGVLYDQAGEELFISQKPCFPTYTGDGTVEQDPDDWFNALRVIGPEVAAFCLDKGQSIGALSLTSQRSSIIPVGRDGAPLYPVIMWQDRRNSGIVEELKPCQGLVTSVTGARINTVFSGTKMTWLHRYEPEIYRRTFKICTIADYLTYRLTGEFRTDHTYGSRSLLMDIRTRSWDDTMLKLFEVDGEKLCELTEPGSITGYVSETAAAETSIPAGIPLISAGGDQQCAALGLGVTGEGKAEMTLGTGGYIIASSRECPAELSVDVICGAHAVPGQYALESSIPSCAAVYRRIKELLFPLDEDYKDINAAAAAVPAGSEGLRVLPYFQGRGTPDWNSLATGSILNLNLGSSPGEIARAVLEGMAAELSINLDILENYMGKVSTIRIGGGLTRADLFNQILSDMSGRTLTKGSQDEKTAYGAWVSAAVTLGLYDSYEEAEAQAESSEELKHYHPDESLSEIYLGVRKDIEDYYTKLYT